AFQGLDRPLPQHPPLHGRVQLLHRSAEHEDHGRVREDRSELPAGDGGGEEHEPRRGAAAVLLLLRSRRENDEPRRRPMKKNRRGLTRREFVKVTGTGALAAGVGANFLFPARAAAQQKTLKIIQWSHFVPAWDTWFNGTYTKEWGQKNNTNVIVDNINLVDLPARAASEVSAKKGHDLFMFLSPPAAYENSTIDMSHV